MVAKVDLLTSRQTADDSPEKAVRRLWLFGPAHRSFSEGGRPPDAHLPTHGPSGPRYPLQVLARSSLWAFRYYRWPMQVHSFLFSVLCL
jgi:hypothetical protein